VNNFPKISIITPCFNSEKYLEETILSVLEQNYPNLEYIIIDGGSADNTLNIIKKYEKKLTYWISEKDDGMYEAIDKGFNKSTGEILAWINSDDLYHKKSLFVIAEIFSNFQNVRWLVGAGTSFDEYGRAIHINPSRKFTECDFLLGDYKYIQQESCFFRRALYEKAGSYIDKTLKYAGDFELWLRFFEYEQLYVVNALIGGFRMRSANQLSLEGMPKYLQEVKSILNSKKVIERKKAIFKQFEIFYRLKIFRKIFIKKRKKYKADFRFNRKTQSFEML